MWTKAMRMQGCRDAEDRFRSELSAVHENRLLAEEDRDRFRSELSVAVERIADLEDRLSAAERDRELSEGLKKNMKKLLDAEKGRSRRLRAEIKRVKGQLTACGNRV